MYTNNRRKLGTGQCALMSGQINRIHSVHLQLCLYVIHQTCVHARLNDARMPNTFGIPLTRAIMQCIQSSALIAKHLLWPNQPLKSQPQSPHSPNSTSSTSTENHPYSHTPHTTSSSHQTRSCHATPSNYQKSTASPASTDSYTYSPHPPKSA